ncbi:MAG: DUF2231 domain-containing protein [Candidatus Eremiobacteraeota bacterium]|nr:DUF2231 domain-containing protein [Candidatus Eremiobacteraeota bacterium]MBC5827307.1 DUF2231 domain-containing protein [Candidatus Eremiobacteraeota bacterium]
MQGKATAMGHPIHPMIIPFPIAFFVGALISDIVSHFSDDAFWPHMSVVLIGFGIIGTLLAALFGYIDYFSITMSDAAKKTATAHMILNLVVLVVFIGAYFVRSNDATSTGGYALTIFGVVVLLVSGALGGQLAYHYRLGVEESGVEHGTIPRN